MRQTLALAIVPLLLAGCGRTNIGNQADDYGGRGDIVAPTSTPAPSATATRDAHVRTAAEEMREKPVPGTENIAPVTAAASTRPAEPRPRFVDLAYPGGRSGLRMGVLRDRETGCEYVVTSLHGEEVDMTERMERLPMGPEVQRCVTGTRGTGYVWIGEALPIIVSTIRDTQTGCEYIMGTLFSQTSFIHPRKIRLQGPDTIALCRDAD